MFFSKVLFVFLVALCCLISNDVVNAQVCKTYETPNSPPVVELASYKDGIRIENVSFEGLTAVLEQEVIFAFRNQRANLTKGAAFDEKNVQRGIAIIKQLLSDSGFMNASVETRYEDLSARSRRVKFIVDEGPPAVIREIEFQGNIIFSADELRSQLNQITEMSHAVYDRDSLSTDLINVRNFMRSRGYQLAKILEPIVRSENGNVSITIPVFEGRLFRVNEITVVGAVRVSADQVRDIIGMKRGDIADGTKLNNALYEELTSLYANMGYAGFIVEPNPEFRNNPENDKEGTVDFTITIREGEVFKVNSIEFSGNDELSETELRRFLHFKEGDTYNRQLVRDTARHLSESGLIKPIDVDVDIEFDVDAESNLISITIDIEELAP